MTRPAGTAAAPGSRADASAPVRVRLLGGLEIRLHGAALPPLESARAESLLAYLLLHRHVAVLRAQLAFLLWPDSSETQARTNLRHLLHTLRRSVPPVEQLLEVTPRTLQWRPQAEVWLDVAAFESALDLAAASAGEDERLQALREAVAAYAGDLLAGCYDEWLLAERERLHERHLQALQELTALLERRGELTEAIRHAEQLQRLDPLREETCRALMRLHDARGDRARALRAYHACRAALERELGAEPSPPTRAAYEALLGSEPPRAAGGETPAAGAPLVGRAAERTRLLDLWRSADSGRAQLVLVAGEPGIGKTRLVEELRAWCAGRGIDTAEARAYPAEGPLAYGLAVAWLRSDALARRRARLARPLLAELATLLPELLDERDLEPPRPLPDDERRRRLFDAVVETVVATDAPLLLVLDDIQWCDRESLQLVHYLLRARPQARLLVAATVRREEIDEHHPLAEVAAALEAAGRSSEVLLDRLSAEETAALAERLRGRPLDGDAAARLFAETEGNPLFVVEALRAGWSGSEGEPHVLSPRVQAVIASRLARLSEPVHELAGLAAAVGRPFTASLLAAASDLDEQSLVRGLDELWRRRIVREDGADAYDFDHDRIREVAYAELGPALRRRHHLRIATALAAAPGDEAEQASAEIAWHFEQAAEVRAALDWYARAVEAAQRVHATRKAVRLAERALALVVALPEGNDRDERELALLGLLVVPVGALDGAVAPRLLEAERRALELSASRGVEPAPAVLRWAALSSLAEGRLQDARALGERLRRRAAQEADGAMLVESCYVLGVSAFWQGELEAAREEFEAAVAGYRPEHRGTHLVRYGLDPQVICRSRLANTLWLLGHVDAALAACDDARALAAEVGHPATLGTALVFAALLALELRDEGLLRRHVQALAEASTREEGRANLTSARALAGYLLALDGKPAEGLGEIRALLDETRRAEHAPGIHALLFRVLLEGYARAGDSATGLELARSAPADRAGAALFEPEVRRLTAALLAAAGAPAAEVESELAAALALAHRRRSRSYELRAAATLVRTRAARGDPRAADARERLAACLAALPEPLRGPERAEVETLLRGG